MQEEDRRVRAVCSYRVIGTPPEPAFDQIAFLAAKLCETPFAYVGLLDESRQWYKARVGFDIESIPRSNSICQQVLANPEILVIQDTLEDVRVKDNPFVIGEPHVRFYAGAPLINDEGLCLGTLCALDQVPRTLGPTQREALLTLARQVVAQLELRRALQQLTELQWQRAEMTSLIVHDLKNPLGAIVGWADLVSLDTGAPPSVIRYGHKIRRTALVMNRMILDMLTISRSEEGALSVTPQRLSLRGILEAASDVVTQRLSENDQRLRISGSVEGIEIRADADMMRRILENLLENCGKYGPKGSDVHVEAGCAADGVEILVRDEGPGIPSEMREAVFQKFVRLEQHAGVEHRRSHGLGLLFCRLAVEACGGRIDVVDHPAGGTAFRLVLPAG